VEGREYYLTEGYCVFRKLVPDEQVESVLSAYRSDILPSTKPFFRQSTNRWARNRVSAQGYAVDSYRDPHDYPQFPAFCTAVRDLLCSREIRRVLTELTGAADHGLMQSMLFDLNTATAAHQDWYYLDSMPNGVLLGAWIALEDISEAAGRFYIVPKSHRLELDPPNALSYADYMDVVKHYFAEHSSDAVAPPLQKGDVLFWNSRTIHGSFPTLDLSFSRKSLTAHYLPAGYEFGSRNATRPDKVIYGYYNGMKFRELNSWHKRYSLWAKIRTEIFATMHESRALRDLAMQIVQVIKH
jgi:phytanoyl-CoA hydroxylase